MIDKTIERTIKFPRVRVSDCSRLIFRLGENPVWRDMDLDPDLFPVYPLPFLLRRFYQFKGMRVDITPGMTINDLIRKISGILGSTWDRTYMHTIIFRTSGELEIQTETI